MASTHVSLPQTPAHPAPLLASSQPQGLAGRRSKEAPRKRQRRPASSPLAHAGSHWPSQRKDAQSSPADTEAGFAMLCGAAQLPASSGKTNRHQLNWGDNCQANSALHMVVICRMRIVRPPRAWPCARGGSAPQRRPPDRLYAGATQACRRRSPRSSQLLLDSLARVAITSSRGLPPLSRPRQRGGQVRPTARGRAASGR